LTHFAHGDIVYAGATVRMALEDSVGAEPGRRRVVIVAYEGVSLLDLAGPLEAFTIARTFASERGGPRYECTVASAEGGMVLTADGVRILTEPVDALQDSAIDTLIVPGAFLVDDVTRDRPLVEWFRQRGPSCRRVCSVCAGTFLLADAGLLDGRRAVTHWMHCDLLQARHPTVQVEPNAIFVRDGSIWSSAGVTTGIDLALALIEEDSGRPTAMKVARVLVVYLKRAGGQSQYGPLLAAQAESQGNVFDDLERWIAEHLTEDLGVEALARRVAMSPRNFARVYTAKRNRTPAKAVEAIRIDAARRLLEESSARISEIAERCGFKNEEQMRWAFARHLGISPREYRQRFPPARESRAFTS
jgi:transcriptional regulator GlxA family with amidase domain